MGGRRKISGVGTVEERIFVSIQDAVGAQGFAPSLKNATLFTDNLPIGYPSTAPQAA